MSTQHSEAARLDEQDERAQRAERVRAMLDRWAAEDVSDEPDWDVEDTAPLRRPGRLHDVAGRAIGRVARRITINRAV